MDLTDEEDIIDEVYCFFVLANIESILDNKDDPNIKNIITRNKKNNEKMEKTINNSKFNIIYLGKEGKIYDNKSNIISEFVVPKKEFQLFNL